MESTYKAIFTDFNAPFMKEVALEPLKEGEIRIKVHAAPVHPADCLLAEGLYVKKEKLSS